MKKIYFIFSVFVLGILICCGIYYTGYELPPVETPLPQSNTSIAGGAALYIPVKESFSNLSLKTKPEESYRFFITLMDSMVVVYHKDKTTIYEYTGIEALTLPVDEQQRLAEGIYVKDEQTLYGILENYSS